MFDRRNANVCRNGVSFVDLVPISGNLFEPHVVEAMPKLEMVIVAVGTYRLDALTVVVVAVAAVDL